MASRHGPGLGAQVDAANSLHGLSLAKVHGDAREHGRSEVQHVAAAASALDLDAQNGCSSALALSQKNQCIPPKQCDIQVNNALVVLWVHVSDVSCLDFASSVPKLARLHTFLGNMARDMRMSCYLGKEFPWQGQTRSRSSTAAAWPAGSLPHGGGFARGAL